MVSHQSPNIRRIDLINGSEKTTCRGCNPDSSELRPAEAMRDAACRGNASDGPPRRRAGLAQPGPQIRLPRYIRRGWPGSRCRAPRSREAEAALESAGGSATRPAYRGTSLGLPKRASQHPRHQRQPIMGRPARPNQGAPALRGVEMDHGPPRPPGSSAPRSPVPKQCTKV